MACFMEQGEAVGAVSWAPDFLPSERGTLIHFYCEEIGKSLERVLQKGGRVITPETEIDAEGMGHCAVFADLFAIEMNQRSPLRRQKIGCPRNRSHRFALLHEASHLLLFILRDGD